MPRRATATWTPIRLSSSRSGPGVSSPMMSIAWYIAGSESHSRAW